jgi:hypothetical protein
MSLIDGSLWVGEVWDEWMEISVGRKRGKKKAGILFK